jgi:hypothetical protein
LKPEEFANDALFLRPEYGTPSLEWDMVDIIDFTCELQNKFTIEISDEIMYLDFIQLRDVYHYLYALKKPDDKAADKKDDNAPPAVPQGGCYFYLVYFYLLTHTHSQRQQRRQNHARIPWTRSAARGNG